MMIAWTGTQTTRRSDVQIPYASLARKRSAPAYTGPGCSVAQTNHSVLISTYISIGNPSIHIGLRWFLTIDREAAGRDPEASDRTAGPRVEPRGHKGTEPRQIPRTRKAPYPNVPVADFL